MCFVCLLKCLSYLCLSEASEDAPLLCNLANLKSTPPATPACVFVPQFLIVSFLCCFRNVLLTILYTQHSLYEHVYTCTFMPLSNQPINWQQHNVQNHTDTGQLQLTFTLNISWGGGISVNLNMPWLLMPDGVEYFRSC